MNIDEAFPSKFLKSEDLGGQAVTVKMVRVEMDQMTDGDTKPIVYFDGKTKGLVLNKTNANNIKKLYGPNTDDWAGKEIILFPAWVDFRGETVEAIRVRGPENGPTLTDRPVGGMGAQVENENPADF